MNDDFHKNRLKGIGGSESAVVLGLKPYGETRLELWQEKTGKIKPFEGNNDTRRGNTFEPYAIGLYEEMTGDIVTPFESQITHHEFPFLVGHPDGKIECDDNDPRGPGILEAKCPRFSVWMTLKNKGIPPHIIIQVQHYLLITGYTWAELAIFHSDPWELLPTGTVTADRGIHDMIINECGEFWEYVQKDIPPPSEEEDETVSQDMVKKLESLRTDGEVKMVDDPKYLELESDYIEAKELHNDTKIIFDDAKTAVRKFVVSSGFAAVQGQQRIIRASPSSRTTFQKKQFQTDHPEINLDDYYKKGKLSYRVTDSKIK
jgi:putative phage-type endonuclease